MRLVPVNKSDIPGITRGYKKSKNQAILEEFITSGHECVRVENFDSKTAAIAASSMKKPCMRFGYHGVGVFARNNELYLVRAE